MRLTLRTLLSYLDDTLEPAQAKIIGQKVAESDQARDLMEHIKQVTRRRRITTPPAAGPGKIDPNTIAEYLDGAVSAEQASEVEQVCLSSDVHLAEMAACHQILALVLGQPALVPPTAKSRMYGLVKGPESIPFRKPTNPLAAPDGEAGFDGDDVDETLRMGMPSLGKQSNWTNIVLLITAGIAVAALLFWALAHVLSLPLDDGREGMNVKGPGIQQTEPPPPVKGSNQNKNQKPPPPKKVKPDENKQPPVKAGEFLVTPSRLEMLPGKNATVNVKNGKAESADVRPRDAGVLAEVVGPTTVKITTSTEASFPLYTVTVKGENNKTAAVQVAIKSGLPDPDINGTTAPPKKVTNPSTDNHAIVLGKYVRPTAKEHSVIVWSPLDKLDNTEWKRLWGDKVDVQAGRTYVGLPGCQGDIEFKRGIKLTLWGNLPEIMPKLPLMESVVDLHTHDSFDVDLTLRRGRIVLTSLNDKAVVRVRFENPGKPGQPEIAEITLHGKNSQVLIDRLGFLVPGAPFFKDPANPERALPAVTVGFCVLQGHADLVLAGTTHYLSSPPGKALLSWNSVKGMGDVVQLDSLPDVFLLNPPLPAAQDKNQLKVRDELLKARADLSFLLAGKGVDVGLAQLLDSKEDPARRVMAIRCYAAIGDLATLVDALAEEKKADVRRAAIDRMQNWIGLSRDNEYKLYDSLKKRFTVGESEKMMELLHRFTPPDLMVDYLNNNCLPIRDLAWITLCRMLPPGQAIMYDPLMDFERRQDAQRAWRKLVKEAQQSQPPKTK